MSLWLFCAILLLDLLLGDPHGWPHPIVWIGQLIERLEDWLRDQIQPLRLAGVLLVLLTLLSTGLAAALLLLVAGSLSSGLAWLAGLWLGWSCLALRSLHQESRAVIDELQAGDLPAARQALSLIVGRDTGSLDEQGIIKATIETVAENASDGVIAPLFYLLLGGPVVSLLYKAASTLDSMVGYKNEKYRDFGWAGARLDDLLNLIPARLTGLLFVLAAFPLKLNGWEGLRIMLRDAKKHTSPNAGWPEAAAAGALGVQLGGAASYFGQLHEKPTFGDPDRTLRLHDYYRMIRLLYASSALFALIGLLVLGVI